jgi:hypothetical protein
MAIVNTLSTTWQNILQYREPAQCRISRVCREVGKLDTDNSRAFLVPFPRRVSNIFAIPATACRPDPSPYEMIVLVLLHLNNLLSLLPRAYSP